MPCSPVSYDDFIALDASRDILGKQMRDCLMTYLAEEEHVADFMEAQGNDVPPRS